MAESDSVEQAPTSRLALAVFVAALAGGGLLLIGQVVVGALAIGLAIALAVLDATLHWLAVPRKVLAAAPVHPIGTAPTGFVELKGQALPMGELVTCAACGRECLWHGAGNARDGGRIMASASPFLVADDGGVCKVSPVPDGVDAPQDAGDHGHVLPGDVVTIRGWHEPMEYDLAVRGVTLPELLKDAAQAKVREWRNDPAMARVLDANRDGTLENRELAAAARAARAQVERAQKDQGVAVRGNIRSPGMDDSRPFFLQARRGR